MGRAAVIHSVNKHQRKEREKSAQKSAYKSAKKDESERENDEESPNKIEVDEEKQHEIDAKVSVEMIREEPGLGLRQATDTRLEFRSYPWLMWIFGTLIMVIAFYFFIYIGIVDRKDERKMVWQWLVAVFIFCTGQFFFSSGTIENVIFDAETKLIYTNNTNFFCCKSKKKAFDMKEVRDVRCFKRGHDGVQTVTVRYEIIVEFDKGKPLKVLESRERSKIIQQMVMIRNFCGFTCTESDVRIFDESSRL